MEISHLRVFDELHHLGITEQEYALLEADYNEQNRTGLYYVGSHNGYTIGVKHDFYSKSDYSTGVVETKTRSSIVIHKLPELPTPCRILCKTVCPVELPAEVYALHKLFRYKNGYDTKDTYKFKTENIAELKNIIIQRLRHADKGLSNYEDIKVIYWLFDEVAPEKPIKIDIEPNIKQIVRVFEKKNVRTAIMYHRIVKDERYNGMFYNNGYDKFEFEVCSYTPKDDAYDFVDVGRKISHNRVWIDDSVKVGNKEIDFIARKIRDDVFFYLDQSAYEQKLGEYRQEIITAKRDSDEKELKKFVLTKMANAFNKKGKAERNGVTYTKDGFAYDGLKITTSKAVEFFNNFGVFEKNLDFNLLWSTFVDWAFDIQKSYDDSFNEKQKTTVSFRGITEIGVGKIKVTIKADKLCYVNDHKVRREDLTRIVHRAVTYKTQADYDTFVTQVSRCNFDVLIALERGLNFSFAIDGDEKDNALLVTNKSTRTNMSLKLVRDNNKNYLLLGDKKLQVSNMPLLLSVDDKIKNYSWTDGGSLNRMIRILFNSIKGIIPADVTQMMRQGMEEAIARLERSRAYVKSAIETTKAERFETKDGNEVDAEHSGYVIKGKSGKSYFVTDEAKTYVVEVVDGKLKVGRYLCIVDDDMYGDKDEPDINDLIARRLYHLRDDVDMAKCLPNLQIDMAEDMNGFVNEIEVIE